jgi:hypothetical protein
MYVYIKSEPSVFTVGHYDPKGKFIPQSDHASEAEAKHEVRSMNSTFKLGKRFEHLQLNSKSMLILRGDITTNDLYDFVQQARATKFRGFIAYLPEEMTMEHLNESDMERAGWVKKKKLKDLEDDLIKAKIEAECLARHLWETHFKVDSPVFVLCGSVAAVISQIDNMTSGMVRKSR